GRLYSESVMRQLNTENIRIILKSADTSESSSIFETILTVIRDLNPKNLAIASIKTEAKRLYNKYMAIRPMKTSNATDPVIAKNFKLKILIFQVTQWSNQIIKRMLK